MKTVDDAPTEWKTLIENTKALHIAKSSHGKVITVKSSMHLVDALDLFHEHNILSAPVINDENTEQSKPALLGFIDVLDLAAFALHAFEQIADIDQNSNEPPKFFKTPVKDIINFSDWDQVVCVHEDNNVKDLLNAFTNPLQSLYCHNNHRHHHHHLDHHHQNKKMKTESGGLSPTSTDDSEFSRKSSSEFKPHRVAITKKDHHTQLLNIVTQSDLARFALEHIHLLKDKVDKKVEAMGLVHGCIKARVDSPLQEVLQILLGNKVSGLALVNEEGKITGNFSASDLRGIRTNAFHFFQKSVLFYLARETLPSTLSPTGSVTCPQDVSLGQVLEMLVKNKIHRVYVTDDYDHPRGVISLTDVLASLFDISLSTPSL